MQLLAAALLVGITACNAHPTPPGTLLVAAPAAEGGPRLLTLGSRKTTPLPKSDWYAHHAEQPDEWSGSVNSNTLVRLDREGRVDLFDAGSLRRTGGFSLQQLPHGEGRAQFVGRVKPSPDGRYLLAYWRASDYGTDDPELAVFDRNGRIVERGLPYRYKRWAAREAIDWLPDGRYAYFAGDRIVIRQPGSPTQLSAPVQLPPHTDANETDLAVSPDSRRLLWSLVDRSQEDRDLFHRYIYVSNLDGTGLHPLSALTGASVNVSWNHAMPAWSPDGKYVAFVVSTRGAYGAPGVPTGCPAAFIVPSDGRAVPLDGERVPSGSAAFSPGPDGSVVPACGGALLWLR